MTTNEPTAAEIAATWFLAARAMVSARGEAPRTDDASAGLYAQAILGISEEACLEAKRPEHLGVMTLVDCLAGLRAMPHALAEKIMVGVLMIAYSDGRMHPLEVRWASMLASAAHLTADQFQGCCVSARVIASMLRPPAAGGAE